MFRPIAIASIVFATPSFADLTAEDVLAEHLNLLSGYGLIEVQTTGTTSRLDSVIVDGILGTYEDDETRVEISTPGMTLSEKPDGSVQITYPDVIEVTVTASPKNEETRSATLALNTTGLEHIVSGTLENLTHQIAFDTLSLGRITFDPPETAEDLDLSADFAIAGFDSTLTFDTRDITRRTVEIAFAGLTLAGTSLMPTNIELDTPGTTYDATGVGQSVFNIALSDVVSRIGFVGEDIPRHSMSTSFGQMNWQQNAELGGDEGAIDFSLNTTDFAVSYDLALDLEGFGDAVDDDDSDAFETALMDVLTDGQSASAALNFASMSYDFGIETPEGTIASSTTSGTSENRFTMGEGGLAIFSETLDSRAQFGGPAMGLPINTLGYSIARSMVDVAIPVIPSDVPQPFRLGFAFEGVSVEDVLWNIFDPEARLSRDPASLVLDIEGSIVATEPPFAEDTDVPFSEFDARLNTLTLEIAGASITGDGAAAGTATDDVPTGNAELNLVMTGINDLIDTAVEMGLLPNEQAMGARMGLSLIARPDGADRLVSNITVDEKGRIFANGMQIK